MSSDRPPRPDPLAVDREAVPEDLRDRDRWICWRYEFDDDRDEWTKIPVDVATGGYASATDPDTWTTFGDAVAYHDRNDRDTDGLGFVFSSGDTVLGIDLDDCRDPETGELAGWAGRVLSTVDSYAEASPSGTGVHVLTHAILPDGGNRADVDGAEGHLELYDRDRYFTVTGQRLEAAPAEVRPANDAVREVHAEHVVDDSETNADREPATAADDASGTDLADDELLEKARNAKNGDDFTRLWNGDTSGYKSHSEARQALANHLAFWTGGDERQMLRLFERSDLIRDDDDVRTFTNYEIPTALEGRTEFYDPDTGGDDGDRRRSVRQPEAADGGATATADAGDADEQPAWGLTPDHAVTVTGVDNEQRLRRLPANELARAVWELMGRTRNDGVAAIADEGPLLAYHGDVWDRDGKQRLREHAMDALGWAYRQRVIEELAEHVRRHRTVHRDELGAPEWHVPVANGLVDVRDPELRDIRREDFLTNKLEYEYDPDAEAPRFREFLNETIPHRDQPKLQEYAGYCLLHDRQPFGKALFLIGPTDSGKGTFLQVLERLVGEQNVANERLHDLMGTRWGGAQLKDAWVNIRNEVTMDGNNDDPDRFKELTGGEDRISAERKREQKFTFRVTQKFVFATNRFPQIDSADEAFYNRLLFVEVPNTIPTERQDPDLVDDLTDELPGILNWALEGLNRLLEQGEFTNERSIPEKKDLQQAHGSTVDRFVHQCLKVTGDRDDVLHKGETYALYNRFCAYHNDDGHDSQDKFTRELKGSYPDIGDSNTTVGPTGQKEDVYTGIRVNPEGVDHIPGAEPPRRRAAEYDREAEDDEQQRLG